MISFIEEEEDEEQVKFNVSFFVDIKGGLFEDVDDGINFIESQFLLKGRSQKFSDSRRKEFLGVLYEFEELDSLLVMFYLDEIENVFFRGSGREGVSFGILMVIFYRGDYLKEEYVQ